MKSSILFAVYVYDMEDTSVRGSSNVTNIEQNMQKHHTSFVHITTSTVQWVHTHNMHPMCDRICDTS